MNLLATSRLVLEPQRAVHAAEMFGVLSDPAIYTHENAPPASLAWLTARFAKLESRCSPDGRAFWLNWVVRRGADGPLIGYVQATVRADCAEHRSALVAYEFNSRYWHQGFGAEAVRALLDELATDWHVVRAQAVLKCANLRSMALLQRLGFTPGETSEAAALAVDADERLMVLPLPA
jgi:[ribosomal protein S5]-alanine N-acetyltransferase